ncbi:MAG: hypothetical protein ABIH41_00835, partial [Nanoarchaeota archaeon]
MTRNAIFIGIVVLTLIAACTQNVPVPQGKFTDQPTVGGAVDLQATQEFRKFDSIEQVSEFLAMHSSPATNYARGGIATGGLMM